MRQLQGADRYHLYVESAVQHQHTLKALLFDTHEAVEPVDEAWLRRWAAQAVERCAPLRWQLHSAGGLTAWVDADDFDLDRHVHIRRLHPPGDRAAFGEVIAELKGTKLDRTRPLWQLWLVDGLEGERAALVWVFHHALADGGETSLVLEHLHGLTADADEPRVRAGPVGGPPSRSEALARASGSIGHRARALPGLTVRSLRSLSIVSERRRHGRAATPRPFSAPLTPFGHGVTSARTCASASVAMDDIAEVRAAFDVTVNDVFLATLAAAVRGYVLDRGVDTARSLTACIPVSIRDDTEQGLLGNRLTIWFVDLATTLDDPVERLRAVSAGVRGAHDDRAAARSATLQQEWMEYPTLFRRYVALGANTTRRAGRPPFTVIASCVRGPSDLWVAGAPVEEIQSYSQLAAGIGLNATAWSYGGRLTIGLVACPEHVPDLWDLADRFAPALAELVRAARTGATMALPG